MTFSLYGGFGLESVSWEDWQIGSIRLGHHFLFVAEEQRGRAFNHSKNRLGKIAWLPYFDQEET